MQLLTWIKSLFSAPVYRDSLEHYVASKYPKNSADVEHWITVYNKQEKQWIF
jgi:hypothetical protein